MASPATSQDLGSSRRHLWRGSPRGARPWHPQRRRKTWARLAATFGGAPHGELVHGIPSDVARPGLVSPPPLEGLPTGSSSMASPATSQDLGSSRRHLWSGSPRGARPWHPQRRRKTWARLAATFGVAPHG